MPKQLSKVSVTGRSSNAVELAQKMATKAPPGVRLGGPGTRSKNPRRFDARKPQKDEQ